MIKDYVQLMRPRHYLKNAFIFIPLFYSLRMTEKAALGKASAAFAAFCLAASAIYIFNDRNDITSDRNHPKKSGRPLASGAVSAPRASFLAAILLVAGALLSFLQNSSLLLLILVYAAINIAYTLKLKQFAILDVLTIAACYVIRIAAGSFAVGERMSWWLVMMTFFLSLFLALSKRKDDLSLYRDGSTSIAVASGYSLDFINSAMNSIAGVLMAVYLVFPAPPELLLGSRGGLVRYTIVFIIAGLLRYMQLSHADKRTGSPVDVLIGNRHLQFIVGSWFISLSILFYWK